MKLEITFNNIWDGLKQVSTVIEFDVEEHIKAEMIAAAEKSEGGWKSEQEVAWKLAEILKDDMSVSIVHQSNDRISGGSHKEQDDG